MPPTTSTKSRKSTPTKPATAPAEGAANVATSEYTIGDDVTHPQFGDGTVTDIEADKLTIRFTDESVRQIVDYYVKGTKK